MTDLRAPREFGQVGLGPIAQAMEARSYDEAALISDYPEGEISAYLDWLKARTATHIRVHYQRLSSPTHFGEIYETAVKVVSETIELYKEDVALTFHLSPGTPPMAAVWVILAKTRFPAELIESSKIHGVHTASVPFDISAEFIPDLLRKPDKNLERLCAGLPPEAPEFVDIVHRSDEMKRVIAKARRVAPRSVPILIEGESGTGKELLARAIHRASTRRDKPFIAVNCGAIPSELIESELFGHEKGAFTGAAKARQGYFEAANRGTLFLDELGELPLHAQVKLLRVLQEGEIIRVGAVKPIKVNPRIFAATNRSIMEEVAAGRFRSDLFYRLAVAVLVLPPLRERKGDVGLLIDSLLEQVNKESSEEPGYRHKTISPSAKNIMLQHTWPGNVRELLNTLRRAAVWCSGTIIEEEDIYEALLQIPSTSQATDGILNRDISRGVDLPALLSSVRSHYLERALEQTHGNKTQAAKLLRISNYQTFTNWLDKHRVKT